ncbi:MAG: STAS domain-containing protein [Gammaproteobacteria bacterium]
MSVTTTMSDENNTLTITILGAFDFSIVHEFRESYSDMSNQKPNIVINLRDTIHIDSSALGMLLNLKRNVDASDKDIKLINVRPDVKKILQIAHFEKLFDIS